LHSAKPSPLIDFSNTLPNIQSKMTAKHEVKGIMIGIQKPLGADALMVAPNNPANSYLEILATYLLDQVTRSITIMD
jgi:hypothetical protein